MSVFPILAVSDVDRAARFYEQAFAFVRAYRFPPEGAADYVYLERGDHGLGLARGTGRNDAFELCVYVDDVDAAAEHLRSLGAREVEPPTDRPWGERMAYFDDPDGHRLHVTMSP